MTSSTKQPQIIFFQTGTPQAKMDWITFNVQQQFELGRRILIVVPNDDSLRFVDQLLWKFAPESFIPHAILHVPSNETIAITRRHLNLNKANVLMNLCPEASPIPQEFDYVFELYDTTHPSKVQLSQQRQAAYQAAGHVAILR